MTKPLYIHLHEMPVREIDGEEYYLYNRSSQWLGFPVMPAGIDLPIGADGEVMLFICQIDCHDIPADIEDLPHDGMLYFFADIWYYAGYEGEPLPMYSPRVKVIYLPEDRLTDLEVCDRGQDAFEPQRITLSYDKPEGDEPDHQLLGEPEHREWEDWDKPYRGWRLLFQMDSCDGPGYSFNFQDWGVLNMLIPPKDLKAHDFSRVVGIILST